MDLLMFLWIQLLEADTFGSVGPHTYFLGMDSLEHAYAKSIYSKVLHTLDKKGSDLRGLCGVSTDGDKCNVRPQVRGSN